MAKKVKSETQKHAGTEMRNSNLRKQVKWKLKKREN